MIKTKNFENACYYARKLIKDGYKVSVERSEWLICNEGGLISGSMEEPDYIIYYEKEPAPAQEPAKGYIK